MNLPLLSVLGLAMAAEPLPAFPGAEGFGAYVTGGRGGQVIRVTSLAQSGPGTLREAIETPGPRIVVFAVSGVIDLGEPNCEDLYDESDSSNVLVIPHSDLTIAGQSAPGAGITLRGRLYAAYDRAVGNVVLRHLRIRPARWGCETGGEQYDALRFARNDGAMFDHLSVAWGVDETVDVYEGRGVTIQDSIIGESATTGHPEGSHNYGLLNNGGRTSVIRTFFIHHRSRNPALATGPGEVVNTVVYDVQQGFVNHNVASGRFNLVGNVFIEGPSASLVPFSFDGGDEATYHIADSWVERDGASGAWSPDDLETNSSLYLREPPVFRGAHVAPRVLQAATVLTQLTAQAGAMPRDVVDRRLLRELAERNGAWGIERPADFMAGLQATAPPADTDEDGMADEWERSHGLDPNDPTDHATTMASGYPAIEAYLNVLAGIPEESAQPDGFPAKGCETGGGPAWLSILGILLWRRRQ
ncbi:MAG: thrombospondin type 3 repeat-containing protein [Myxococcota bacterium]